MTSLGDTRHKRAPSSLALSLFVPMWVRYRVVPKPFLYLVFAIARLACQLRAAARKAAVLQGEARPAGRGALVPRDGLRGRRGARSARLQESGASGGRLGAPAGLAGSASHALRLGARHLHRPAGARLDAKLLRRAGLPGPIDRARVLRRLHERQGFFDDLRYRWMLFWGRGSTATSEPRRPRDEARP